MHFFYRALQTKQESCHEKFKKKQPKVLFLWLNGKLVYSQCHGPAFSKAETCGACLPSWPTSQPNPFAHGHT